MKKVICIILLLALSVVFAVSAYLYISEYLQDKEQLDELESIAQTVHDNAQNADNKYAKLYAQNNDFMGWLRIDGTGIDYPVMQSKDDPDFYLKHNFSKEYSRFGIPYMQENCGLSSDNIIIYGHNIKSKSMFNELTEYKNNAELQSKREAYLKATLLFIPKTPSRQMAICRKAVLKAICPKRQTTPSKQAAHNP